MFRFAPNHLGKYRRTIIISSLLWATLCLNFGLIQAQSPSPVTAQVDRTTLAANETFILTVEVNTSGSNAEQPAIPAMSDFQVVGTSSSTQMSIINGAVSSKQVYQYRLQPLKTGTLTVAPINIRLNGQTYQTDAISIEVSPANITPPNPNQPAPGATELNGQDIYVEAEVDNPAPYPGEQITYTFRFYQANGPMAQARYVAPPFNGFWIETQPDQKQFTSQIAGRIYHVAEVQTILFPTRVEPLTIEPASAVVRGRFLSPDAQLSTEPVTVNVQPLPDGAPAGFQDAVGQFSLKAEINSPVAEVNEPVTLRVILSGQGNLNTLPDPIWPTMTDWRTFDSQATVETRLEDGNLVGNRTFEWVLIPEKAGTLTIPPITYPYFNPQTESYETLTTDPIDVSITPLETELPPVPDLLGSQKTAVTQIGTDIRHLKPAPTMLATANAPLTAKPPYWFGWLLPVLLGLGHTSWRWHRQRQASNTAAIRRANAYKKAINTLHQLKQQPTDAYASAGQILNKYLTDKLNQPTTGLTQTALCQRLAQHHIPQNLRDHVTDQLQKVEMGRFAPHSQAERQTSRFLRDLEALLGELEEAFQTEPAKMK